MANQFTAFRFISDTHKECSMCGEIKEHKHFHKDSKNIRNKGLAYYCRDCACKNSRKNHKARIDKNDKLYKAQKKNGNIKQKYGITLQEYTEKLVQQKTCAICGVELSTDDPNVHLDHCHKTGKIRAFLCSNCNRGIGCFHDETWKLQKAIEYLNSHSENENS